jgi:hypothetical protein
MKWISESEFVIGDKVYHCINPEWIKKLIDYWEKKHDNDTPKDQRATKTTPKS